MKNNFNIELFRKSIFGLNKSLENIGAIFHKNIDVLSSEEELAIKEEAVDKMGLEISENLDELNNSYLDFKKLFEEVDDVIKNNNENKVEYMDFMNHVEEVFPKYISELNQSMNSMSSLDIKTEKFKSSMNNLNKIIINIISILKMFLKLSNSYLEKE